LGKKRNEQVEEIEENGREELWGLTFLYNIKPSSFGGTKKLYWRMIFGGFGGIM
jgi:hypothetical protein